MELTEIINSTGLFLDIIGVTLVYIYGLPSRVNNGAVLAIETSQEYEVNRLRKNKIIKIKSWSGYVFLMTGFILQFLSNFIIMPCS